MEDKTLEIQVEEIKLPVYEIPTVTTYTDEQIMEEIGPAQANEYQIKTGVW